MTQDEAHGTLVLVPTEGELRHLEALGGFPGREVRLCGFGPVAAAATSAGYLGTGAWRRVLLVGIAGTYRPEQLDLGQARSFAEVALPELGALDGQGGALGVRQMGFPQWRDERGEIFERLPLQAEGDAAGLLLTVSQASGSPSQAQERARPWPSALPEEPGALAEDMEGFGVALAARLAQVPCTIVRGISNVAGDRAVAGWKIEEALSAARLRALEILEL